METQRTWTNLFTGCRICGQVECSHDDANTRPVHADPLCGCYADAPHTCGPHYCRACGLSMDEKSHGWGECS